VASVPDGADFTPNPDRAIWIEGRIEEALLERFLPEIFELTAQSREPITVFINSRGGMPNVAQGILNALRRTTPDDARVSKIITVAAPRAQSAAANLLAAGDFAIAHPDSDLLYHGGRWPLPAKYLTAEVARDGRTLHTEHEKSASMLSVDSFKRFRFIVSALRPLFAQHRAETGDPTLADMACVHALLRVRLSPAGQKVLDLAVPLSRDYDGLFLHFQKRLRRGRAVTKTHLQKLMLYASADFEWETTDKGDETWDAGFGRIADHFYFLNAYFDSEQLREWCAAPVKLQTALSDAEVRDALDFRLFHRALCRALQEGENYLTPSDALWLGLIDTVSDGPMPW
jgi:ATP-dependent protease ClpP protease subunit